MELIRPDININFVGMRFKAFALSIALIVACVALMVVRGGLNLGVDFAGGSLVQIQFKKTVSPDEIRAALKDLGMDQSAIQQVGAAADNEYMIRTDISTEEMANLSDQVQEALNKTFGEGQGTVRRAEMVGPKVGQDLRQKALFAIFYAMLFIAIYISGRFEMKWGTAAIMVVVMLFGVYLLEAVGLNALILIVGGLLVTLGLCWVLKLPYALAAVIALVHDVLITVGVFVVLDKEFTLEILAALLTIAGYSLNDTIVVFDRIRENLKKERRQPFMEMINSSINQTLSRTILTGGTTLFALVFLFFFGGTVIQDFALAMLIGIVTGTYSSVFIASPLLILYEDWTRVKRAPVRKAA
ncbi:MAG: protein translocase subunit SecF [Syntrophobacteraceae bacterium]|jgi:preprotein translocase subunit SecF|nr:protein translocase subunit SecF [Syntrophobacteraceae bacterium]